MRLALAIACAAVASLFACAAALAAFPWAPSPADPHDYSTLHAAHDQAPNDFSETDSWKMTATPEGGNTSVNNLQDELCGIRGDSTFDTATTEPEGCKSGAAVHTAWNVTTGRPDVVISVLDSGIKWNDSGAMTDLRFKVHINRGELPPPEVSGPPRDSAVADCSGFSQPGSEYDVNGDGVFNLKDYECDPRVSLSNPLRKGPASLMTPQDLILAFSNGDDHDNNGYVDDIAGWDFVDNKNDPYDDVQYGHGTGEARDSNAEADNGGDLGTCPNCMVLPLRVGESFIADANRFAQAVLYATDNGASVVQEALGTLNESRFAGQAIDYAYHHGVTVIASAADEAAEHHNQPGSLAHTIVVNSVREYADPFTSTPRSYLQFNGCTNFSTRVTLSVPSTSCSSEATGRSAGVAGLIYSAALNAHHAGDLSPSGDSDCTPIGSAPTCVVTPAEVRELMASGHVGDGSPADQGGGQADDVHFADTSTPACNPTKTPNCTDPNTNTAFNADQSGGTGLVLPLAGSRRYHARTGFDQFYGYGRLNAYNAVNATRSGTIPPEADITSPRWFQRLDPSQPSIEVDGYVNARTSYTCKVEVAPGDQPDNTADFHAVSSSWCDGSTVRSSEHSGALGTIDTSTLKGYFPSNTGSFDGNENAGLAQTSNGRPNTAPYAFTVRVVVTTASGSPTMSGEDRRQLWLHRDQDMLSGFPKELQTDGDSSPLLVDLDGDNRNELVIATSDGDIHAYRRDGSELPGWPVHTDSLPLHTGARAYTASDGVGASHDNAVLGALAAGDLFHDGRLEIVADDHGGNVYAWDSDGHRVFHQAANPNFSGAPLTPFHFVRQGPRDRTEHGFLSSPVLADLDGHGLDIVAAGEDRHLYAWHADGSAVGGFPVEVYDHDKVTSVDPTTGHLTFDPSKTNPSPGIDEDQGKIIDTPAAAKLDGADKPPSILIGTNEEYPTGQGDEGDINAGVTTASLGALGATGVLGFANGRVYAIKHDGTTSGDPYRAGWPKKVGIIDRGLLPDVGEGVDGSPVVAPLSCPSGGSGMKVGVHSDAGPGYVFNADGSSCYGQSGGHDNALATDFSTGTGKYDTPTFPAVGYPAFGKLTGADSQPSMFTPTTGIVRAVDVIAPEYQGGQDFLGGWDTSTGQFRVGFPSPVNDLQFLTGPVVGDVTGTSGQQQVIGGTASLDLAAVNAAGAPASSAWPKMTGDWTVATPTLGSFGTLDTDSGAKKDVVSITRMGSLSVYSTPAGACSPSDWPRFHHDLANSGDYTRDAVPPGKPTDASVSGVSLTFKAPGDDLLCGTAHSYELVGSDNPITPQNFAAATPLSGAPAPAAAGTAQTARLPNRRFRYVGIRAVDEQGNVGLPAVVDTRPAAP